MIETRVICDCCKQPLPIEIIEVGGKKVENVRLFATKEWDTRLLFPHLCENCATKIDLALLKEKNEVMAERLINNRNKQLNAERREKLGTKG